MTKKPFGLIGGLSWHSTVLYYSRINDLINIHFGKNINPAILLFSLNQHEINTLQKKNNWDAIALLIVEALGNLRKAGVDTSIICANTPHKVFNKIRNLTNMNLLHIADPTAAEIIDKKITTVGLLGTIYTMEEAFYKDYLFNTFEIKTISPAKETDRVKIHSIITSELSFGVINKSSKNYLLSQIKELTMLGAEGIILGCTELSLIVTQKDTFYPLFDTMELHCQAVVKHMLVNKLVTES